MNDPAALQSSADDERFKLIGSGKSIELRGAIDGASSNDIETTIDGASTLTLTVRDPDGDIRRALRGTWRMTALGMDWELAGKNKSGSQLALTFEDRLVADLRRRTRKGKASRNKVTRAQFIRSRVIRDVRRAGGKFICPQLNVKQPVGASKSSKAGKDSSRGQGFPKGARLKGKEGYINMRNAELVLDIAAREKAGKKATLALVMACIVEAPDFKNPSTPSADGYGSYGILQAREKYVGKKNAMDIDYCVTRFLRGPAFTGGKDGAIALARKHPTWTAGKIAQTIEGSAYPLRYDQYKKQAERIIDAYGGSGRSSTTKREAKRFAFTQGPPDGPKNEDAWDMAARLAEQVGWRRFVVGARDFYYISERDLMKSRSRMVLREREGGVDTIDFDDRENTKIDQCTVTCRAKLWSAPPGSIVEIEGQGEVDGRWLVSSVRRPVFSLTSTIELRRGRALVKSKREPAAEAVTRTGGSGGGSGRGSSGQMVRPVSGGSVPAGGVFGAPRERGRKHAGLDIAVPVGTSVKAALGGTIAKIGNDPAGYGIYIDVRHSGGLMTRYAHLSKTSVSSGKRVDRGQVIGKSGNTGSSTGPHLHFEVHKSGVPQNPKSYI